MGNSPLLWLRCHRSVPIQPVRSTLSPYLLIFSRNSRRPPMACRECLIVGESCPAVITHQEQKCPVDHPLIVLEGGGAGYERVPGTEKDIKVRPRSDPPSSQLSPVYWLVWLRLPHLRILRHDVLSPGRRVCSSQSHPGL